MRVHISNDISNTRRRGLYLGRFWAVSGGKRCAKIRSTQQYRPSKIGATGCEPEACVTADFPTFRAGQNLCRNGSVSTRPPGLLRPKHIRQHFQHLERFREALKAAHPDSGGSTDEFARLQEAKRILDAHHGKA